MQPPSSDVSSVPHPRRRLPATPCHLSRDRRGTISANSLQRYTSSAHVPGPAVGDSAWGPTRLMGLIPAFLSVRASRRPSTAPLTRYILPCSLREIATELGFLFSETVIALSFINVGFLLETLWSPTKFLTLQPAFILASMAFASLERAKQSAARTGGILAPVCAGHAGARGARCVARGDPCRSCPDPRAV
ncbi:hypothetical protein B0H17DRAFT_588180 [Mycena rosella]|uniref:Uncharacterized protein n=1 Tax=Mycena rosella TaxID=1033263 RepID=A0AAD7FJQ7_MYCRO|nr:hypothetical protein B0H17DRAFT_588180 [Mycena rosella]